MENFYDPDHFGYQPHDPRRDARKFEHALRTDSNLYMDPSTIEDVFEYYQMSGATDKAAALMQFAIDRFPFRSDFYLKKSLLDFENLQLASALHNVNIALDIDRFDTESLLHKVRVLFTMERDAEAIEITHMILDFANDAPEVYYNLGLLSQDCGRFDLALSYLKNALQHATEDDPLEDALNEIFYCYEQLDKPKAAIDFCKRYLDHNPYSAVAWYHLSLQHTAADEYEKALQAADYAILINEQFISAYFAKGSAQMALGDHEDAIKTFLESMHYDPNDISTLLSIAEAYEALNQSGRARFYYTKLTQLCPDYAEGWNGVAGTLEDEGEYLRAIHFYRKCLDLDTRHLDAWLGLAECEYHLGNELHAFEALEKAIMLDPSDLEMWRDWGERLAADGEFDKALELLELGFRSNPQHIELAYQYVAYAFQAGETQCAFVFLENALLADFESHKVLYRFAPKIAKLRPIQEMIAQYQPR